MNSVTLPAPLLLKSLRSTTITPTEALSAIELFLVKDAPTVLSASATTRAALERLIQGLKEELERKPVVDAAAVPSHGGEGMATHKKRKNEKTKEVVEGVSKKRKIKE